MSEDTPNPSGESQTVGQLRIGNTIADVLDLDVFNQSKPRRFTSFVTNFGNWQLPADVASALDAPVGHLEWVHDTGELVLVGGIAHVGAVSVDVPAGVGTLAAGLPAALGGTAVLGHSDTVGMVRMYFNARTLPPGSRVAILGRIHHGPRVHEVLWGWHEHHRRDDGWEWLVDRLTHFDELGGDDKQLL